MVNVLLGLGSNRSFNGKEPVSLLKEACLSLRTILKDIRFSSIYKSAAMYYLNQEDFYNMAVTGKYEGSAFELLDDIHKIEETYGRDRKKEIRNGPRPIDIDIELFGSMKINSPSLIIPHERMLERAFVLMPAIEILEENADVSKKDIEFYKKKLFSIKNQQQINLYLSKEEFFFINS